MIDLHCHLLHGVDDGPKDLQTSIEMSKIAVEDGIKITACTPHIYQGLYNNNANLIKKNTLKLQKILKEQGIKLSLTFASDTHIHPDLVNKINKKEVPTFNGGRYFLLEPSHHQAPLFLEIYIDKILASGLIPIMTHPERLTYIKESYAIYSNLIRKGAWIQITAGSLTGKFGKTAQYWAERFINEGKVHLIASDAHGVNSRPPILTEGLEVAKRALGETEAMKLVIERPKAVLNNSDPTNVSSIGFLNHKSLWHKLRNKFL